jgi:hypothetical protein
VLAAPLFGGHSSSFLRSRSHAGCQCVQCSAAAVSCFILVLERSVCVLALMHSGVLSCSGAFVLAVAYSGFQRIQLLQQRSCAPAPAHSSSAAVLWFSSTQYRSCHALANSAHYHSMSTRCLSDSAAYTRSRKNSQLPCSSSCLSSSSASAAVALIQLRKQQICSCISTASTSIVDKRDLKVIIEAATAERNTHLQAGSFCDSVTFIFSPAQQCALRQQFDDMPTAASPCVQQEQHTRMLRRA